MVDAYLHLLAGSVAMEVSHELEISSKHLNQLEETSCLSFSPLLRLLRGSGFRDLLIENTLFLHPFLLHSRYSHLPTLRYLFQGHL